LNRDGARVFSNLHETLRVRRLRKLPIPHNHVRISYATGCACQCLNRYIATNATDTRRSRIIRESSVGIAEEAATVTLRET